MSRVACEDHQLMFLGELRQYCGGLPLPIRVQVYKRIVEDEKSFRTAEKELRHGQTYGQGEKILRACRQ